jgi:hypothetical protein
MPDSCCTPYSYVKSNTPAAPVAINRLAGGMSDQERMRQRQFCNTNPNAIPGTYNTNLRPAPPAYATGGQSRDSSFLTMQYAMKNSWQQSRGLGTPATNGCCTNKSFVSSDRTFTNNDLVAANTGAQIAANTGAPICTGNRFQ